LFLFFFSLIGYPDYTESFIDKPTSPHCYEMLLLSQIKWYIFVGLFWTLDCLSVPEPISHRFSSCSFIITLDIWMSKLLKGLLCFFMIVLSFLGPLYFQIYFNTIVSIFTKISYWIVKTWSLEPNLWEKLASLFNWSFNPWMWYILPFMKMS